MVDMYIGLCVSVPQRSTWNVIEKTPKNQNKHCVPDLCVIETRVLKCVCLR